MVGIEGGTAIGIGAGTTGTIATTTTITAAIALIAGGKPANAGDYEAFFLALVAFGNSAAAPGRSRPCRRRVLAADRIGSAAVAFTPIQELGLKLESTKGPVEVLVVDSVEKPTEN